MGRQAKSRGGERGGLARRALRIALEPLELRLMMDVSRALESVGLSFWEADPGQAPWPQGLVMAAAAEAGVAAATTAAGLPILNSLSGAPTAVYLDFDGDTGSETQAYDDDGDSATFNAAEQAVISEAWRQMSVYFSIFNTNVTTIRPSVPMAYDIIGNNAGGATGGYAYVGAFPSTTPMAFNVSGNAKSRVSGMAHEVGHVFGLAHQSTYDLLGNKTAEYASEADPLHGPMMGVDYAGLVHKWLMGHPSGSASDLQDDVAGIAGKLDNYGGDGFRTDDYPNVYTSAVPMAVNGPMQSILGIIERLADVDAFSFMSDGGRVSISAAPDWPSAVDVKVSIASSDGKLLAMKDAGTNYQQVVMDLPAGKYYALVSSHGDYGDLGSYTVAVRPMAAGWTDGDLGLNGIGGYGEYDEGGGAFTMGASGADLWGKADGIHLAYQKFSGNGTIIARVTGIGDTDPWAKAGVMIRETLGADSKSVAMVASPKNGPQMSWRSATGGDTAGYWGTAAVFAPIWLKLERVGTTFRGYRSSDGVTYTLWSTATVSMSADVYIGLALTSHNQSKLNVSTFESVSLSGTVGEEPPVYNALAAPTGLKVVAGPGTGLNVSWTASEGASGYAVERSSDGVDFARVGTTSGVNATAYSDNGLLGSMRYFYRVSALDDTGGGGESEPSGGFSFSNRPSAPGGLTITSLTTSSLVLNWKDVSGDTGYRIERSTDNVNFASEGTVGKNVPSFTDTGLGTAGTYYYRVIPLSALGDSPASTAASGMTRLTAVPGMAFDTIESRKIVFHWSDIIGESSYRIDRSTDGVTFSRLTTLGAGATSYTDAGVQPLKEYYYRVVGVATGTESMTPTAIFTATPATTALPSPWTAGDIGAVNGQGAAGYSSGTFTVVASGRDIWDNSDALHFVYQPLVGDGEIAARVAVVEDTDEWAKVGVMIRETLNANSKQAMVMVTPGNGVAMQHRLSTGGGSQTAGTGTGTAPYWVRLVRKGSVLSGYASTDGVNWGTAVGTVNLAMTATVYIGLAVASHNTSELNTTSFDNVTVSNRNPTVATGASAAPNPVTGVTTVLSVLGADDHGEGNLTYTWTVTGLPAGAANPTFSVNAGNAAKSSTATFSRAGVYTFVVTIADSGALTTTSTVNVTVQQTLTALDVLPDVVTLDAGATQQFTVSFMDQFGQAMVSGPAVTWTVSGGGSISSSGFFTAPAASATSSVRAAWGSLWDTAAVTTVRAAPAAPSDLGGELLAGGGVLLSWVDHSTNEDGFRIERSFNGGAFGEVGMTGADVSEFSILSPGTGVMLYRVAAFAGSAAAYGTELVALLAGGNFDDVMTVALDSAGASMRLTQNAAVAVAQAALVSRVLAWGGGGSDELVVDGGNGMPSLAGGMAYDGGSNGAAGDSLRIVGSARKETVTFTASLASVGPADIALSNVEGRSVALGTGEDVLNISGMSLLFAENAGAGTSGLTINASNANLTFDAGQDLGALNLAATSTAVLTAGGGKILATKILSIATGAQLDLTDNDLVVLAGAAARAGVFAQVTGWVRQGRTGTWRGNGISSSTARTEVTTGLAAVLNDRGGGAVIRGNYDVNAILVKYTYNGDVNLDGAVNLNDYFVVDTAYLAQGGQAEPPGYGQGDVNYDGAINLNDYFMIDSAYLGQKAPLGSGATGASAAAAGSGQVKRRGGGLGRRVAAGVFGRKRKISRR